MASKDALKNTSGPSAGVPSIAKGKQTPARQRVQNWSHSEVIALILCKQKEHVAQKSIVDPRSRMIPATQKWQKISEELQLKTCSKVPRNPKMCKDKWNGLQGDYKKVADYHKGTGHYMSYWDLSVEDKDKMQLPRQFHSDFYDALEAFQGDRVISNSLPVRDSQAETNIPVQGEDNVPLQSAFHSQEHIVNLSDTPAAMTSTAVASPQQPTARGVPGPGNTLVKRKRLSAFTPVIEATDKSSKVLVDAMDRLNATQKDLEKARVKVQRKTVKSHVEYLQKRDKKTLKMSKNMVTVLSNLSTAMCHAFIKDPAMIPPPVNLSQSSSEGKPPTLHCLETSDEDS